MNNSKIGNLLAYISSKIEDINLRKLIKLVFLIDEESVRSRGISVTWLTYYAWEKGPVAPCIYEIKDRGGIFSKYISVHRNREEKVIITPFVDKNESSIQFSKKELRLIDSIIDKYGQLSADDLSEITHKPGGLWDIAKKKYNPNFKSSNGRSDIKLNLSTYDMEVNDNSITLTQKEFEILKYFMQRPKLVVSKDDLITKLWGFDSDIEHNNIEVYISFLRKKLAYVESNVKITTIRRVGYRLE